MLPQSRCSRRAHRVVSVDMHDSRQLSVPAITGTYLCCPRRRFLKRILLCTCNRRVRACGNVQEPLSQIALHEERSTLFSTAGGVFCIGRRCHARAVPPVVPRRTFCRLAESSSSICDDGSRYTLLTCRFYTQVAQVARQLRVMDPICRARPHRGHQHSAVAALFVSLFTGLQCISSERLQS